VQRFISVGDNGPFCLLSCCSLIYTLIDIRLPLNPLPFDRYPFPLGGTYALTGPPPSILCNLIFSFSQRAGKLGCNSYIHLPLMSATIFLLPTRQKMTPALFRLIIREDTDGNNFNASSGISRIGLYIIGSSVAGTLILGVALWLAIRFLKRRGPAKKGDRHGAPLISVPGNVEEAERPPDDNRKSSPE
jgi:hypothetical protein